LLFRGHMTPDMLIVSLVKLIICTNIEDQRYGATL
jgi:hypothetical protein